MTGPTRSDDVKSLQADLRALGYLYAGIDGVAGQGTERAIRALQWDLLNATGASTGSDGPAAVAVGSYNQGRVAAVTGSCDAGTAACIAAMIADPRFPKLPSTDNAAAENARIPALIDSLDALKAPAPFLRAIVQQESNGRHWREPSSGDSDSFVLVGLDTNDAANPVRITSRGYGVGQATLFHHPPRAEDLAVITDVATNLRAASVELRAKFDRFVVSSNPAERADDRAAEIGNGALRPCRYPAGDARYMKDCVACAHAAGQRDIVADQTPVYPGATTTYHATAYYKTASYAGVPDRAGFGCDWPYAVRRYNGAGINSYHYQVKVLIYLRGLPAL